MVSIGTVRGGTSPNLVPDEAYAAADNRLPMGISANGLLKHLHSAFGPLEGGPLEVTRQYEPSWTSTPEDVVKYALYAARSVVDPSAMPYRVGASDSRLFRQHGIPTIVAGLTLYNMGGPDEYFHRGAWPGCGNPCTCRMEVSVAHDVGRLWRLPKELG
ncbi:hypothetical protein J3458_002298 [Metarhizium acridum]|uniref:uncharacterized protein n=1 Tax=Metarhizium acridum TaxID=92637 RepID=UPI001C6CCA25|nr:hypothetical protein J3458_002298 [Metarhizium acridum]